MRRGEAPTPALPAGRWDDLDHVPRGTAPEKDLATGQLHEAGGGTYRVDEGMFVAKFAADGSVKITDGPNVNVHLALPTPKSLGRAATRWYYSDKGPNGAEGDTSMAKQIQAVAGSTTDPDDRSRTVIVPILAGGFDATDALMRAHGQDPYASRKLKVLDGTRDERVQIGNRHRAEQLKHATQLMQNNLDALWARSLDVRARKQALFELWDECVEAGDPALVEAGAAARRLVIGAIRAHLPATGPDAYTAAELAALARAKQSRAAFAPYD